MRRRLIFAFTLAIMVSAIGGGSAAADRRAASLPPALLDVEWSLVTMQVGGQPAEDVTKMGLTIKFAADGSLSGSGGCNRLIGSYTGDANGALTIATPLGSTLIACPQAVSDREARYFASLPLVRGYSLTSTGQLRLRFDQADRQLVYNRPPGSLPTTGGGWGARHGSSAP